MMKLKNIIPLTFLLAALPHKATASPVTTGKPNLLFIMTDDQSRWSVSSYGGKNLETPHIDKLAAEGALFENAFVDSPVCSPSRIAFLTGKHSSQVGVTDYLNRAQAKKAGISPDHLSWPSVLQKSGYSTGLIGKWHVGSSEKSLPENNGFSYFVGNLAGGWSPKNPVFRNERGERKKYVGYSVDVCTDLAMDFLSENKKKPFALLLNYREPHAAYIPMPEVDMAAMKDLDPTIPQYPDLPEKKVKKLMRDYLTAVRAVDRNVGRLMQKLKELGLDENTIVVFTSDHGYNMGHHGLQYKGNGYWLVEGKRGCRPNMFDTSVTIPLLIKWPGVVAGGTRVKLMVSNVDTFSSMLGMLGVAIPDNHQGQGRDYSPLLRGEKVQGWRDSIFGQYQMINNSNHSMRMIRTTNWKLIRHYKVKGKDELYHLLSDPGERNNLYLDPQHVADRNKLQQRLDVWMKSIGDDPLSISPQRIQKKQVK